MTPPQDVGMRFDLPFCLHLQDGFYDLALGSRTFKIETRKVWRNSQDCSDDDSVAEQRLHFAEGSHTTGQMGESFEEAQQVVGTNMEMVDDPHGRFRYTTDVHETYEARIEDGTQVYMSLEAGSDADSLKERGRTRPPQPST